MSQKSEAERYKDWYRNAKPDEQERAHEERRRKAIVDYRYSMSAPAPKISKALEFFRGSRRWGFMIGLLVFKFPTFANFVRMVSGFREQLEERYWWCSESGTHKWNYPFLNEILWADRFGFIQISRRCAPVVDEPNFDRDFATMDAMFNVKGFRFHDDGYMRNLGYTADGRLVFIDYGYFGGLGDCYLGCPNGFSIVRGLHKLAYKAETFVRNKMRRRYGLRVLRVVENDTLRAEENVFDLGRRYPHDVESVRSALVNRHSTTTSTALVERVSCVTRATHAVRTLIEDSKGLSLHHGDYTYWRVTERPATGTGDVGSDDVTE